MSNILSIMIISSESKTAEVVNQLPEVEVSTANVNDYEWPNLLRQQSTDVLMVELNPESDMTEALNRIERLKSDFPDLSIFALSSSKAPELIIASMRAGVQEFFTRPVNEFELGEAIERARRRKDQVNGRDGSGKLITVFSKAGGSGVTTLAVNLGIALAQVSAKRSALLELNLQHGAAASFLNLSPRYSIIDTCDTGDQVSSDKLQSCMTHHDAGLSILSEPPHPAASDEVSATQVQQVLVHLRSMYPYVIVDTPHDFEPRGMTAMDLSDIIIVVTLATVTSIQATKKVLGLFREQGYSPDKIRLIVNRVGPADRITPQQLQETLDYSAFWTVPNNYRAAIDAINSGIPLVAHKRLSNIAKNIIEMAETINRINYNQQPKLKKVVHV